MPTPEIICLGELLIDMVSTKEDVPLAEAPGFVRAPGGAPANVAVAARRLGASTGFIGKVGRDFFGFFLRSVLEREGVDCSHLAMSDEARTTLAFIGVHSSGEKDVEFYRHPGADQMLCPQDITPGYVIAARAFHFGSISMIDEDPRAATLMAAELAKEKDVLVSFDPNYRAALWDAEERARDAAWTAFRLADLVKISEEEWELLTGTTDFARGAERILEQGARLVVVSRGENGCWFMNAKGSGELPGLRVDVAETIGAGDGFVGALLTELLGVIEHPAELADLEPDALRGILRVANAAGALTCTKVGAIPALPTRRELDAFLKTLPVEE